MKRYDVHEPHDSRKAKVVLVVSLVGWIASVVGLTFWA